MALFRYFSHFGLFVDGLLSVVGVIYGEHKHNGVFKSCCINFITH